MFYFMKLLSRDLRIFLINFVSNKKGDFNLFIFLGALVMLILAMTYSNYVNNNVEKDIDFFDAFQDEILSIPDSIKNIYIMDYFYYKEKVNNVSVYAKINFYEMIGNCEKYMGYCVVDDLDLESYMDKMQLYKDDFLKELDGIYIERGQKVNIISN